MFSLIALVATSLLLIACVHDYRTREIPDWISIAIGVVAVVTSVCGWLGLGLPWVLGGGLVGLLFAMGLYRFAKLGGGDGKLIIAMGMLVGPVGLLILLFGMAIVGGILSLVAIARGQHEIAYVPAITAGFVGYVGFVQWFV